MEHSNIDAVTGPTIRKVDAVKLGEGHTVIKVDGMTCENCANTVAQAIFDVPGVMAVKVFLDEGKAMYDVESPVEVKDVAAAIEKAGYQFGGLL